MYLDIKSSLMGFCIIEKDGKPSVLCSKDEDLQLFKIYFTLKND